jgi:hypothetical protein
MDSSNAIGCNLASDDLFSMQFYLHMLLKKIDYSREFGVCGASIKQMGFSCLIGLKSDLYYLCGPHYGPDIFCALGSG